MLKNEKKLFLGVDSAQDSAILHAWKTKDQEQTKRSEKLARETSPNGERQLTLRTSQAERVLATGKGSWMLASGKQESSKRSPNTCKKNKIMQTFNTLIELSDGFYKAFQFPTSLEEAKKVAENCSPESENFEENWASIAASFRPLSAKVIEED